MARNYKRRNFFINKRLQGKMMFQVYLLLAVGLVLFSGLLLYFTSDSLTIVYQNNDLQVGKTPLLFVHELLKASWILLIPIGLLVVLWVLLQSHRTAGPLYKFEMVLDAMISGRIGGIVYVRKKDEGQELAKKLTVLNRKLGDTFSHLQSLNDELELCTSEQDLSVLQQRMQTVHKEIQTTLETYTIEE
ncbi:MAG: hypothetical protein PF442_10975 [Desulfobulbaceae bacterium]|jgi:hypothetical protein|nr:hypothetical protein [Desulfobulbaceae bacterium]